MYVKKIILLILWILVSSVGIAQTFAYKYIDPCTGIEKTIQVPSNGITVTYYGQVNTFSANDFYNGGFETWAQGVYSSFGNNNPCASLVGMPTSVNIAQNTAINFLGIVNSLSSLADMASGTSNMIGGSIGSVQNSTGSNGKSGSKNSNSNNAQSNGNSSGGSNPGSTSNNGGSTSTSGSSTTQGSTAQGSTAQGSGTSGGSTSGSGTQTGGTTTGSSGEQPSSGTTTGSSGEQPSSGTTTGSSGEQASSGSTSGSGTQTGGTTTSSGSSNGSGSGTTSSSGTSDPNSQPTPDAEGGGKTNLVGGSVGSVQAATSSTTSSGGKSSGSVGSKNGNRPTILASSDFVGFNFKNSDVTVGGKVTGGYSSMRWDGKRSYGINADYTTAIKGPNITGFYAVMGKRRIDLISTSVTVGFEKRMTIYGTLALGQMWTLNKPKNLKVLYMLTGSAGQVAGVKFIGTAAIAGGMYDWKISKRISIKMLGLYVYAPYVSYYNDVLLKSPHVILPIIGTNIGITKRFKLNVNAGGAWAINESTLNYTIMLGTRMLL